MSSPLVAPPIVKAKALFCPNCGGPVERRGFAHTLTIVCPQCLTVLDASQPLVTIIQKVEESQRRTPLIPLGQRGKWDNATWEVIGYQTRGVEDEGEFFEWEEYLLFNPYKGFRYLTNYQGHWNYVTPLEPMPQRIAIGGRPAVTYQGHMYRHFSGALAKTTFILGEFPWRVKAGDEVLADDFVMPPWILSSESTNDEVTWSWGVYTKGSDLWKAFSLPDKAPNPQGTYLNQPSPFTGKVGGIWGMFLLMLGLLIAAGVFLSATSRTGTIFEDHYSFTPGTTGEPSFVTKTFEVQGKANNLQLDIDTNLTNNWAYFNLALINETSGEAFDFGKEVSYYSGSDSDGSWTEGSQHGSVTIPQVPGGRYYLRVEPEMEAPATVPPVRSGTSTRARSQIIAPRPMYYGLSLRYAGTGTGWFWLAALLLLIPPIIYSMRAAAFESKRWMQSDYPQVHSS